MVYHFLPCRHLALRKWTSRSSKYPVPRSRNAQSTRMPPIRATKQPIQEAQILNQPLATIHSSNLVICTYGIINNNLNLPPIPILRIMFILLKQLRMHPSIRHNRMSMTSLRTRRLCKEFLMRATRAIWCACEGYEVVYDCGSGNASHDGDIIPAFDFEVLTVPVRVRWD